MNGGGVGGVEGMFIDEFGTNMHSDSGVIARFWEYCGRGHNIGR